MTDLRSYLIKIDKKGELIRIKEPMSPRFEIPAALKRFDGREAILFEDVVDYEVNIVGGVNGSRLRLVDALGVSSDSVYPSLQSAVRNPTPCAIVDGPVKEVVIDKPNLSEYPVLTHFEHDPGPYITSGIVHTKGPEEVENVSFHRLLVIYKNRLAIRVVPRQLYRIMQMSKQSGMDRLDISISIGLHPVLCVASALPTPFGTSEFDVANSLLGGSLKLTKCEHVDALAPASAELVFEGKIDLNETVGEGPFVDLSGTYDVKRQQPVVKIVGAMHREDYIYQALLPSSSEHRLLMGMPREVRIWEYVRNVVPTVRGINLTSGGMGWLHCVVSFNKFREGDPKNVLMAIFAAHPSLKHAIVVDSDIDPYNMEDVEWAIATRFRGDKDLLIIPDVRVSSLDPVSDQVKELGCKVGVDATKPLDREGFTRPCIPISDRIRKLLDRYDRDS
jgi:UbiD family decarboxylase